jgi:hypothetical protein
MIKETDIFGVYVPPILAYAALAALIWRPLRIALERAGFYPAVWHPPLFNLAAYAIMLALVVAALK